MANKTAEWWLDNGPGIKHWWYNRATGIADSGLERAHSICHQALTPVKIIQSLSLPYSYMCTCEPRFITERISLNLELNTASLLNEEKVKRI
jgi:hypothetical protein